MDMDAYRKGAFNPIQINLLKWKYVQVKAKTIK